MGDIPESEAAMAIPEPPSWLTLRVFYLRLSRCEVDESMLDALTVTYAPLTHDTILEVTGGGDQPPPSISTDEKGGGGVLCSLRRDRVDAASEEASFVSTAAVRVAGSVRFEVQNGDERLLVGILETCDVESLGGDDAVKVKEASGGDSSWKRSWVMKCQVATQRGSGFLRCGREEGSKAPPPAVEVYVGGVFRGTPIVFSKAMLLRFRRRRQARAFMEPIPECAEPAEDTKETAAEHEPEESEYRCYKPDPETDDSFYIGSAGRDEGDYSELSWFTAGVRVGVGISLGIFLGVGIGAGLLARSYKSTSSTLKRRLISNLL
ncbi:hypothetical protein EJB05_07443, partial [Eragrostis curvula]